MSVILSKAEFAHQFALEYHMPIYEMIASANEMSIAIRLEQGMNPDWRHGTIPFLYHALVHEQINIVRILLAYDPTLTYDGNDDPPFFSESHFWASSDICSYGEHYHTTALMQLITCGDMLSHQEMLSVAEEMIRKHAPEKDKQQAFLCTTCSCGETAISLARLYLRPNLHLLLCELFLQLDLSFILTEKEVKELWECAVIMKSERIIMYLLQHYTSLVSISDHDIEKLLTPFYDIDTTGTTMIHMSKQTLLSLIQHKQRKPSFLYVTAKGDTLLHTAILFGDFDVLCAMMQHRHMTNLLDVKNHLGEIPVEMAMNQGIVLHALVILQAMVGFNKLLTSSRHAKEDRKRAYAAFYEHMDREIERCLQRLDPTKEMDTLMELVRRLVLDVTHPSGIGFPDGAIQQYQEMMNLQSEKEIKQTIAEWAKTNPLLAMRWEWEHNGTRHAHKTYDDDDESLE